MVTDVPLSPEAQEKLGMFHFWGWLSFVAALAVRAGLLRAIFLLMAGASWVFVIDCHRRKGWPPAVHRRWQQFEIAFFVAMLLLSLFNRVLNWLPFDR
jgi:hypothetical protein